MISRKMAPGDCGNADFYYHLGMRQFLQAPVAGVQQRWFLVLAFGLLSWPLHASAGLSEEILGKWRYKGKQAGATIESVAEFKRDGVYECTMNVGLFGTRSAIKFKGKWRVEEDVHVIIEVTETSSPLFLPKGKVMRKEAVKIEEDVMTYRYSGKPEKEERVIDPAAKSESGLAAPPNNESG